jgi:hypothetical protein
VLLATGCGSRGDAQRSVDNVFAQLGPITQGGEYREGEAFADQGDEIQLRFRRSDQLPAPPGIAGSAFARWHVKFGESGEYGSIDSCLKIRIGESTLAALR